MEAKMAFSDKVNVEVSKTKTEPKVPPSTSYIMRLAPALRGTTERVITVNDMVFHVPPGQEDLVFDSASTPTITLMDNGRPNTYTLENL